MSDCGGGGGEGGGGGKAEVAESISSKKLSIFPDKNLLLSGIDDPYLVA